jgi:hypothetical protein
MNTSDLDPSAHDVIAQLCAEHLHEEERLLRAAVPMARAVKDAFAQPRVDALMESLRSHEEFSRLLDDLRRRRRVLCQEISERIAPRSGESEPISLTRVIRLLPLEMQDPLLSQLAFVRQMAEELVHLNHWLAVHARIHLDAYERMLQDLVGSAASSGRYGPHGKTEAIAYRPLLEIHG